MELDQPTTETSGEVVEYQTPTAIEMPVAEFEGEFVRLMVGNLPSIAMEMPVGYARGTHLKMEIEVRVKGVRVDEGTGRHKGDLVRYHALALEEIKLIGAYTADQMDPGVGGSASIEAAKAEDQETDESPEQGEGSDVGF